MMIGNLFYLFVFFGEVESHGGSEGREHIGFYSMAHTVRQDDNGSVLLRNSLTEKDISANAFAILTSLLAIDLNMEILSAHYFSPEW
jgi:hypothetical protein